MTLAPQLSTPNPFQVKVENITIDKFTGSSYSGFDQISLMDQFGAIEIYQSIFSPLIRAELLLYDPIGLFSNYPITGQERISVSYSQVGSGRVIKSTGLDTVFPYGFLPQSNADARTIHFMITSIENITPKDQARGYYYVIKLVTNEMLNGIKVKVSEAFKGPMSENARKLWDEYVYQPTRLLNADVNIRKDFYTDREGRDSYFREDEIVVPMLTPMESMKFFSKHAIALNPEVFSVNLFFENFYGYFFTTLQSLTLDQAPFFNELRDREKFLYMANRDFLDLAPPGTFQDGQENRLISNLIINNRFGSFDKILGGYFSSELYEVNAYQRGYFSERVHFETFNFNGYMHPFKMNTEDYGRYIKNNILGEGDEKTPHTKYEILTWADHEYTARREKYNSSARHLIALDQNDMNITIPGDMTHNCGQIIYVEIPEMHGYNNIEEDPYITGYFMITEIKTTITKNDLAATVLKVNKDSYTRQIASNMEYVPENQNEQPPRVPDENQAPEEGQV